MGDAAATVLGSSQLIGIMRFHDGGDVSGAVDALARGGIELLEITIDTPVRSRPSSWPPGTGARWVSGRSSRAQVAECAAAGARVRRQPRPQRRGDRAGHELGLEPIPASSRPPSCSRRGSGRAHHEAVPGVVRRSGYLRALRGPFPTAALVPTGGVRIDEIRAYLDAGATVVALGCELVGRSAPRTDSDLEWIASQAAGATSAARVGSARPRLPADAAERTRARRSPSTSTRSSEHRGDASYCDEHGIALRPHIKTHKLPQVARLQVDAGARGITCQKLGEAEVFADAGFDDILISFPLVGQARASASRRSPSAYASRSWAIRQPSRRGSPRSRGNGEHVEFLVECDTGFGRTGARASTRQSPWLRSSRGSTSCASRAS